MAPAVHEWTGQGLDNLWSNAANWTNGSPATDASGDIDLVFHTNLTNAAQLITQNDIVGLIVDSITFDANAGTGAAGGTSSAGYTINGNTININTGAAGQDPFGIDIAAGVADATNGITETFNVGITLATTDATFRTQQNGARLTFTGALNLGTRTLTIDNAGTNNGATQSVLISGNISNGNLTKNSGGTLQLSGNNSYGNSTFNNGVVLVDSSTGLGAAAGTITANDPTRIELRNGITVVKTTLNLNSNQLGGGIGANGNTTNTFRGAVVLMAGAGGVAMGAGIGVGNANTRFIVDGLISGATSTLSLNGAGVVEFTQNNTYTGFTNHNGNNGFGALQIDTPGGLGAGGAGNESQFNRNGAGPTGSALWLNFSGTLQDAGLVGEVINFAGSGVNSTGAIRVLGNNNVTIPGNIIFIAGAPWNIGVDVAAATLTTTGVIDDQGANRALTKVGAGTLTIGGAAANTYSGGTIVNGGILNVTNTSSNPLGDSPTLVAPNIVSMTNGSTLQVQTGVTIPNSTQLNASTLAGAGTVGSVVSSAGAVSPGLSTAIVNVSGIFALDSASTLRAEINGTTAGTTFDQVNVTGAVSLGGATLVVQLGFAPAAGNAFTLINNDGADPVGGTFAGLPQGSQVVFDGFVFTISYTGGSNGNDVVLTAVGPATSTITSLFAVGTGPGVAARVKVYNADGSLRFNLSPYKNNTGGVRVAVGDVTGDNFDDIITCAGNSQVKVFNGATGALFRSFLAYPAFAGRANVAVGDINNDGKADIITAAEANGHVKVFDVLSLVTLRSFLAFPGFTGAVTVAAGDINNDGIDDIIVGAGADARVKVFDGATNATIRSFQAYPAFSGSVTVASKDINNDSVDDIITGAGPGAGPKVKIFSGVNLAVLDSFFAFNSSFQGGIFVG